MPKVKILVPGEYMNTDLRVKNYQAGEILETRGWYAEWLIGAKQAEASNEPEAEPAKKARSKKEKPVTVKTENPFL